MKLSWHPSPFLFLIALCFCSFALLSRHLPHHGHLADLQPYKVACGGGGGKAWCGEQRAWCGSGLTRLTPESGFKLDGHVNLQVVSSVLISISSCRK